tara:strand:+ start:307 stop:555 length:249 start_codon:yes stop_codon:yes gene_type:complete
MCYPNGGFKDISKVAHGIVRDLFQLGFTLEHGEILKNLDNHLLPRIFASFDYNCFKYNLNNSQSFNKSYMGLYKKYMEDKNE